MIIIFGFCSVALLHFSSLGIASLCLSSLSLSFENFLLLSYILGFKIFSSFFLLSFLRHFLEVFICCSVSLDLLLKMAFLFFLILSQVLKFCLQSSHVQEVLFIIFMLLTHGLYYFLICFSGILIRSQYLSAFVYSIDMILEMLPLCVKASFCFSLSLTSTVLLSLLIKFHL